MKLQNKLLVTAVASLCIAIPELSAQRAPFHYGTPGDIVDFKNDPEKQARMQQLWNWNMNAFAEMGITGNPWTNVNDAPRPNYQNPARVPEGAVSVDQPITWTAFPNKVMWYFNTSQNNPYQLDKALLYPLADEGRLDKDSLAMQEWLKAQGSSEAIVRSNLNAVLKNQPVFGDMDKSAFVPVTIPSESCPVVNWAQPQSKWRKFNSNISGPRGWKDEYNEWAVTRNEKGQITKINFTAENPEYWFTLWNVDPNKVLELYRELVHPSVELKDLQLTDKDGKVVPDYAGNPYYNPLKKWNYGNNATSEGGGAVHLTSPPNTVGAEIYLGAAATILRNLGPAHYSPMNNICSAQYGGVFRNSDPNIGIQANQVVRNINATLTLKNPIALYMQKPDFSNYVTPDGTPAEEFFTVVRGRLAAEAGTNYDQILHGRFEVPASKGYTISDITIGGMPIWWGAQIAETFNQALAAEAFPGLPPGDVEFYPPVAARSNPNAWAQPLVTNAAFKAVASKPAISAATIPLLPPAVTPGTALKDMALEVISGSPGASIEYVAANGVVEKGIKVTIKSSYVPGDGNVTGKHQLYDVLVYVLDIEVGDKVTPGQYGVRVTNPGAAVQVPVPGNLTVLSQ